MNHPEYTDWCDECDVAMTRRSKDGLQIICEICWTPKPVPLTYLNTSAKIAEVKRLKTLASAREAILS